MPESVTGERVSEQGEERDEIETDRDSFTPATTTAGRGRLISEFAYSFIDNRRVKDTHSLPELILRYGLTEWVELRLGWNYEVGGAGSEVTGSGGGAGEEFAAGRGDRANGHDQCASGRCRAAAGTHRLRSNRRHGHDERCRRCDGDR